MKTLKVAYPSYWGSLVPSLQHTANADTLLSHQFESLVREGPGGTIFPGLAKTWTVSRDFTSFSFKLDSAKRFSNGKSLSAKSVKEAWEYGLSLEPISANHSLQDVLYLVEGYDEFKSTGRLKGLEVLAPDLIAVHFKKQFRTALTEFSTGRMSIFIRDDQMTLGTGPYIIEEIKELSDHHLRLSPNKYSLVARSFEQVEVAVVEPKEFNSAFQNGTIDFYAFSDRAVLDGSNTIRSVTSILGTESGHSVAMVNGLKGRLFSDQNLRKALQFLITQNLKKEMMPPSYQINFEIDPQTYLRNQPGRIEDSEALDLIEKGRPYIRDLIEASKSQPIHLVTSEPFNWLQPLLVNLGLNFSRKSGFVPVRDRVHMYYQTFEPDLMISGASLASGDPDGLFHLLSKDGAISSPMIIRENISHLLDQGRSILDCKKLDDFYKKVTVAIIDEVPFIHLGFLRTMHSYDPTKIELRVDLEEHEAPLFTRLQPVSQKPEVAFPSASLPSSPRPEHAANMSIQPKNLSAFAEKLSTARIIGLGELVHGVDKIHRELGALVLAMIGALGTETVLIEVSVAAAEAINLLLKKGQLNPVQVADLDPLYRIWRTASMANLLDQIRTMNQLRFSPVQLIGIDIRGPTSAFAVLHQAYLKSGGTAIHAHSEPFDLDLEGLRSLEDETYFDIYKKKAHPCRYLAARENLNQVLAQLNSDQSPVIREAIAAAEDWLLFYNSMTSPGGTHAAYLARDAGLYRHVSRLESKNVSRGPIVLLAHFCHLLYQSEALIESPPLIPKGPVLGTHLRNKFNERYIHIAVGAVSGQAKLFDGSVVAFKSMKQSFERIGKNFEKNGLITLKDVPEENQVALIGELNELVKIPSYLKLKFRLDQQADYLDIIY